MFAFKAFHLKCGVRLFENLVNKYRRMFVVIGNKFQ